MSKQLDLSNAIDRPMMAEDVKHTIPPIETAGDGCHEVSDGPLPFFHDQAGDKNAATVKPMQKSPTTAA